MRSLFVETSTIYGAWRYEGSLEMLGGDNFDDLLRQFREILIASKDRPELDLPQRVMYIALLVYDRWKRKFSVVVESLNDPTQRVRVTHD